MLRLEYIVDDAAIYSSGNIINKTLIAKVLRRGPKGEVPSPHALDLKSGQIKYIFQTKDFYN